MSETKNDAENKLELDFAAFELEIDREIDALLVPLAVPPEGDAAEEASPEIQEEESGPAQGDSLEPGGEWAAEGQLPLSNAFADGIAPAPILQDAGSPSIDYTSGTQGASRETEERERSELPKLMESFRVAYLSLDWDFSVQNLTELDESLGRLQPYCDRLTEAQTIFKILKVLLQRLKAKPDIASPQMVELIRGCQDLLVRVLEGRAGAAEKEETRRLFQQVQSIRRSIASEEQAAPGKRARQEVEGVSELREWMESSVCRLSDVTEGLEEETRRIQQILEILEKKPALAPLTARIAGIRTNLEAQVRSVKDREREWRERIEWLGTVRLEAGPREPAAAPSPAPPDPGPAAATAQPQSPVLEQKAVPLTVEEQVCLFDLSGKRRAVLASHVVKVDRVNARTLQRIRRRGFATLSDFKPLFRCLKTGLSAPWTDLPSKTLKAYRFTDLPYEELRVSGGPAEPRGVLLVSNGQRHGLIPIDSAAVQLQTETITRASAGNSLFGSFALGGDLPVEVLDIDVILNKLH